MKMKIYLDMDGVITDFERRWEELYKGTVAQSKADNKFSDHWRGFVLGQNFSTLDWYPGGKKLVSFIDSLKVPVEILSSSGGGQYHDEVTKQKIKWLNRNGITYKPNIVPGGLKKRVYAGPWNILIDDTDYVVEAYTRSGGGAILHKSAEETITQLSQLNLEWHGGQ